MNIKTTGLESLKRKFEILSKNATALHGKHSVPLKDMLTPSFLSKCSKFTSFDDMIAKSGFKVESQEDFTAIPDEEWDAFIRNNSEHSSWKKMLKTARMQWVKAKLGY